MDRDKVKD